MEAETDALSDESLLLEWFIHREGCDACAIKAGDFNLNEFCPEGQKRLIQVNRRNPNFPHPRRPLTED